MDVAVIFLKYRYVYLETFKEQFFNNKGIVYYRNIHITPIIAFASLKVTAGSAPLTTMTYFLFPSLMYLQINNFKSHPS